MTNILRKYQLFDVLNESGKSVLHELIIESNMKEIQSILDKDKNNIGRPVLSLNDSSNKIPLHYAISSNCSDEVLDLILDYTTNEELITKDNNGNNALHVASYFKNKTNFIKILNKFVEQKINISKQNKYGNTALHISCMLNNYDISEILILKGININSKNYTSNFAPLNYSVDNGNIKLVKLLISYGSNYNEQDFSGNTILHHAISAEKYDIIEYLLTLKEVNVNKFNIQLELPIHIFISKCNDSKILSILINLSLLNLQNINGETPLLLLIKNNMWKDNIEILKTKKLDIFAKTKTNERPIDKVSSNDMDEFKDMLTYSYLSILDRKTNIYNKNIFEKEWENICGRNTMSSYEINILQKYIKSDISSTHNLCYQIINKHVDTIIKDELNSYPVEKNKHTINIEIESETSFCTFVGLKIDIVFGLIYLIINKPNISAIIDKNLLIKDHNDELSHFEITWKNNNLIINKVFTDLLGKLLKKSKRFIIIPLGIELDENAHSNYLLYDKETNEIERFEPYGCATLKDFNYNSKLLDEKLEKYFGLVINNIKYINPEKFMSSICFQHLDAMETNMRKYGDPGGFCAVWSIWYVDMRTTYHEISRSELINKLMKNISYRNYSFKNLIRGYSEKIVNLRNKFLNYGGITINDWINERYEKTQLDEVFNLIGKYLSFI